MTVAVVNRGSHVHHVFHIGLAQIEPLTMFIVVNTTPISADDIATSSYLSFWVAKYMMLAMNVTKNARAPIQPDDT
jgi:hypothetical protein